MVNSLNTKWKEFLFGFSGFGPNFLMVLMGAYFSDAINPAALGAGSSFQAIASGTCFVLPVLFPILFTLGKVFDGIIDIPFAHITDTLSTKWGRRRPAIAVCMIPMALSYLFLWMPIGGADVSAQLINTLWVFFWSIVFFASYTMCLIAFYGSLSTTCKDEAQRLRVSGYKSFFDTISYCFVYALVPIILDGAKIHIDKFVFICMPLMATIIIPLFLIKEGEKYGYPENQGMVGEKISLVESIKLTFTNRIFLRWTAVNCCTYFGLQMFLVGMNAMILGGMNFSGIDMAIINTCAFAPVPVMLWIFNKVKSKRGIRFTYQSCLISFAIAIMSFFFASVFFLGYDNRPLQFVISCLGSLCGSWAIGAFFMMPYLAPAQISSVEEKLTGKNHSAMYFAANAVTSSIVGAISGSLVYEYVKNLFISKKADGIIFTTNIEDAASKFGVAVEDVYNLGTLIIPFVVAAVCILGYLIAFKMPRDFSPLLVAREFKKMNPELDSSAIEAEAEEGKTDKTEIVFVQIGLSVLSGFIFGFIWAMFAIRACKDICSRGKTILRWVIASMIPFASALVLYKMHKELSERARELDVKLTGCAALFIALSIVFPILPINVVSLALMQHNINKIYLKEQG